MHLNFDWIPGPHPPCSPNSLLLAGKMLYFLICAANPSFLKEAPVRGAGSLAGSSHALIQSRRSNGRFGTHTNFPMHSPSSFPSFQKRTQTQVTQVVWCGETLVYVNYSFLVRSHPDEKNSHYALLLSSKTCHFHSLRQRVLELVPKSERNSWNLQLM